MYVGGGGGGRSLRCYLPVRDLSNSVSVTQAVPQSLHTLPVHSLVWGDSYLHENGLLTLAPGCGDETLWHDSLSLHVTACLTQQPGLLLPSKHPSASGCSFGQESQWFSVLTSTEDVWERQRGQRSPAFCTEPYTEEMATTCPLRGLAAGPCSGAALVAAVLGALVGAETLPWSPQVGGRMGQAVPRWISATIAAVSTWNSPGLV